MKKHFIAKLLVLAMILSMVPITILAASADSTAAGGVSEVASPSSTTKVTADSHTVGKDAIDTEGDEPVIKADVVGTTASAALTEEAVESLADAVVGDELVLVIEAPSADKVRVSFPAKALTKVAKDSGAKLTLKLGDVATITIPNEALTSEFGEIGSVRITVQDKGSSVGFTIQVGGRTLKSIKGLTITF